MRIKKPYMKVISTVLVICMLIGILPQTVLGADKTSNNSGNGNSAAVTKNSGYFSLKGRAKQEVIVQYKDKNTGIDTNGKNKDPKLKNLKSKGKLNEKTDLFEISSNDDIAEVIEALQQDPAVEYAQPNYEVEALSISNDEYIDLQWGVQNNEKSVSDATETNGIYYATETNGVDINLASIMDVPTLNDITVAIIDSGIDIGHEDLAGKIYTNPNEKTNNNKDNDGNGYIGDVNGWNFIGGNNAVSDMSGHGTAVAGIVGAVKNNIGVMGVAQNVKLLPLKVIENGIGYTSDVIEAIQYADSMGAKIANCSFGSEYFNNALFNTINASSMLFICAAGNTGTTSSIYPASYGLPKVLSVTSIDRTGALATNASYGQAVDIAAPGVDIYSTGINNTYAYVNGSSFAAAYATGAAARLLGIRNMTAEETKAVLDQGATKTDSLNGYVKTSGMLNVSGSYDLIKDGHTIDVVNDTNDTAISDKKITQMLKDNNYSGLTEEDKRYLCDKLNISRKLLEECISAGYSLETSVSYAAKMGRFGFTLDEIIALAKIYGDDFDFEFDRLNELVQNLGATPEDLSGVKQLMLSGYMAHNVIYTYMASKALDIPIETLVKKDQDISSDGYKGITGTNFTEDDKKNIWKLSVTYWLDINVLIDYMIKNNLTYNDVINKMSYAGMLIPLSAGDYPTPEKYPAAPFSYRANANERINLNTGSLTYENTDVVLPGKNGMDLDITTRYDSSAANIDDVGVAFSGYGMTMYGWLTDYPIMTNGRQQSSNDQRAILGTGWSFGFSYIENNKYLHLSDGNVYTLKSPLPSRNLTEPSFEKYDFLDMRIFQESSSFTNGQTTVSYSYVLEYKDGRKEYFTSDGRLLGQQDRFGNTIMFEYTSPPDYNGKWLLTTITDTLNRIVTITYPSTPTAGGYVTITLPDNSTIKYLLEKTEGYDTTFKLSKRIDQLNRETNFTYETQYASEQIYGYIRSNGDSYRMYGQYFGDITGNWTSTNSVDKRYLNLKQVIYPTKAVTEYSYMLTNETMGSDTKTSYGTELLAGITQIYRVSERSDKLQNLPSAPKYNDEMYGYTNSYMYPHIEEYSYYTYSTTVTNATTGNKIITVFNNLHLRGNVITTNSSNVKLLESIYSYNANKQVIASYDRTYGTDGVTYQQAINNYAYDDATKMNNVIAQWSPLAGGNTASAEYETIYTYDPMYNYVTSKQYKQNSDRTVTEEYIASPDHKTITYKFIYETTSTTPKTRREGTWYFYDVYGNICQERRYYGDLTALNAFVFTDLTYTYNADGTSALLMQTWSITDADGQYVPGTPGYGASVIIESIYIYDKMGRTVKSTDANGNVTTYTYDLLGRQTQVTNPDGTYKTYVYDDTANTLTETNEIGTQTKYFYDGFGNITDVRDIASGADLVTRTYDTAFRVTQESTLSTSSTTGSKTDYTYDALDRVLTKTVTGSSNAVLSQDTYEYTIAYGAYQEVKHTVVGDANSPSIVTTTYTDNAGRSAGQGYYIAGVEYTEDYTYDYVGNKMTAKTAQTKQYWNSYAYTNAWNYDYAGRVTNEYDIYGNYSTTTYDALGQKVSFKDPKGSVTTYQYDGMGRLIIQKTPFEGTAVSTVKYYYNNNSNVTQKKVSSNAIGAGEQYTTTGYEYNSRNMLTKAISYNLNGTAESYAQYYYDAAGNKLRMYTGLSTPLTISGLDAVSGTVDFSVTKYEYDRFGNLTKLTDPMGYTETYTYDLLGNMLTKTDRNGTIFTYSYDGLGRLLSTVANGTVLESYTYTLTGNKRTESNATVTTTNIYDGLGRLALATDTNSATGVIMSKYYYYDIGSNKTGAVIYFGGTKTNNTSYTYDEADRMKTVSESGVLQCTYNYDVNGNRSSMVYANGVTTEYTYNLANMLKTLTNKNGTAVLSLYSYEYQLDGNQISKTDKTGKVTNYVYDGLGRLISETEKTGGTVTFSLAYQYDTNNNRTSMTTNNGTVTTYSYDKNNRLTSTTEPTGTTTYKYDNNGNTLTATAGGIADTYGYDVLNRMTTSNVGGVATTYKYRTDGLRFSKTTNGVETVHIWDGANIVGDIVNGVIDTIYVRGINIIASKNGSIYKYYLYNGHGDTIQICGETGTVFQTYDYDAFGNSKYDNNTQHSQDMVMTGAFAGTLEWSEMQNSNPATGVAENTIVLHPAGNPFSCALTGVMALKQNTTYVLEFDYIGGGNSELYFTIFPSHYRYGLAQYPFTPSGVVQRGHIEIHTDGNPDFSSVNLQFTAYGTDDVYVSNVRFYQAQDTRPLRYTGEYFDYSSGIDTNAFTNYSAYWTAARVQTIRPDTGKWVEAIELKYAPEATWAAAWTDKMDLDPNAVYVVEFDYWSDTNGVSLALSLPMGVQYQFMTANRSLQRGKYEMVPNNSAAALVFECWQSVGGTVYVSNVLVYRKDSLGAVYHDQNNFRFAAASGYFFDDDCQSYYCQSRYFDPVVARFMTQDSILSVSHKMNGINIVDILSLNLYTFCYNNPIRYSDPSGNIVQLSGSSEDQRTILDALEELTDYALVVDKKGNVQIYYNTAAGDKRKYTSSDELLIGLINSDKTCTIGIGDVNQTMGTTATKDIYMKDNGTPGKGADVTISFAPNPKLFVGSNSDVANYMYIALGHELIHASRYMAGRALQGNKQYVYNMQTVYYALLEDIVTTGIYIETHDPRYVQQITENTLRAEHGLQQRDIYDDTLKINLHSVWRLPW